MDNQRWEKSRGKRKVLGIILSILIFLALSSPFYAAGTEGKAEVFGAKKRVVKVGFFPMEGFHEPTGTAGIPVWMWTISKPCVPM